MKILIVNKFLYPNGGSETYIFKLGDELRRQGHEVQFFGMEHEGRCVGNNAEVYTSDMDFHTGKLAKLLYPFKIIYSKEAYEKIKQVLDDFKPDVVQLNNFNFQLTPSIIYAVRDWEKKEPGRKVKLIYTAHDGQLVCPNHLMQQYVTKERCAECIGESPWNCAKHRCIHGSLVKSILGSLEASIYRQKKTYGLFDAVICPSDFLKKRLDSLPELHDKTVVMHNFVDAKLGADVINSADKENYILYLGRYSEEKGVKTLLKVITELNADGNELPFKFAGNGPLEDEVNSIPNIENLGFLTGDKLVSTIKKAKFTIFPSECNENCPFTVIESQLYGTPLIASNVGGVPEVMKEGVTGELFEPGDGAALKEKILMLWNDSERLKAYTDSCLEQSFDSLEEYVDKYIALIKD